MDTDVYNVVQQIEEELAPYSNYLTRADDPHLVHLSFVDLATSAMQFLSWVITLYLEAYLPERGKRDAKTADATSKVREANAELEAALHEIKELKGRVSVLEMREEIAALEADITDKLANMGLSNRAASRAAKELMPMLRESLPKLAGLNGSA